MRYPQARPALISAATHHYPVGFPQYHHVKILLCFEGGRGGTVVKVLWYIWEGRWFDPSWCHWSFSTATG